MKRVLLFTLFIVVTVWAQIHVNNVSDRGYARLTISDVDSTDATASDMDTLYVVFPSKFGHPQMSETLPTDIQGYAWHWQNAALLIEPDTVACAEKNAAAETDSVQFMIKPIVYDPVDDEYAVVDTDSLYLTFQRGSFPSAAVFTLDWDVGTEYVCALSDSAGNLVFGGMACGVMVQVAQMLSDLNEAATFQYDITLIWREEDR